MPHSGRKILSQVYHGPLERLQKGDSNYFEDLVRTEKGVHCSVKITDKVLKIFTPDYRDFVLAKSVIAPRSSLMVEWKEIAKD